MNNLTMGKVIFSVFYGEHVVVNSFRETDCGFDIYIGVDRNYKTMKTVDGEVNRGKHCGHKLRESLRGFGVPVNVVKFKYNDVMPTPEQYADKFGFVGYERADFIKMLQKEVERSTSKSSVSV